MRILITTKEGCTCAKCPLSKDCTAEHNICKMLLIPDEEGIASVRKLMPTDLIVRAKNTGYLKFHSKK